SQAYCPPRGGVRTRAVSAGRQVPSFPRSAWERPGRRSASRQVRRPASPRDAERRRLGSHAERGNQEPGRAYNRMSPHLLGLPPMPGPRGRDNLPRAPVTRQALREALHLFGYVWRYRLRFSAALLCLLTSSLLMLAFPYLAGSLVDSALPGQTARPLLPWHGNVNAVAATLAAVLAVQAASSLLHASWFGSVGACSLTDLRRDTYGRLICLPMAFFSGRRVGELSSRIAADLAQIQETFGFALPHFLRQVTMLSGGILLI